MRTSIHLVATLLLILCKMASASSQNGLDTSSIEFPWSTIDLTAKEMKPGYEAIIPEVKKIPLLPIGLGTIGAGTLIYLLTQKDDEPIDCNFSITSTTINSTCGLANGEASISTSTPGDYDYSWSNGVSTSTINNVSAGTYFITVTKSGTSCKEQLEIVVTDSDIPFPTSISIQDASCGEEDGSATVSVEPTGAYTYLWSNGITSSTATNLAAGEYTVTVNSSGTCSQESTIVIESLPFNITLSFNSTSASCGQSDGSAEVIVDPSGNYTYLWSNGNTTNTLTNVIAGDYSVTVSLPGENCSEIGEINIPEESGEFNGTTSSTPADCGLSNGFAMADFIPESDYTYLWSNGSSSSVLTDISAGDYMVTVTNAKGCTKEYTVNVEELPTTYIDNITSTDGDCTGDGEISITLVTPGSGPIIVFISGPDSNHELSFPEGQHNLSSSLNILPGTYTIIVYDVNAGISCAEETTVTIEDDTPELTAIDDHYETTFPDPVIENALSNDSGLQIELVDVQNILGGTVSYNPDGSFTFIPEEGYSGEAMFEYFVIDICGDTASAIVIITVHLAECDFKVEFTIDNASCGLSDGAIDVTVTEPGNYNYTWDDGTTGPVLNNVQAGTYSVTIEDVDLNCSLTFSDEVGEDPAQHIANIQTIQPDCVIPGDVFFDVFSSGPGVLIMEVNHPNGNEEFSIVPAQIMLSDFIIIAPGDYTITVYEQGAGITCSETFSTNILPPTIVEIVVEGIHPPSSPSTADGAIIVAITIEGELPYSILLNGSIWGVSTETVFTIDGVESGFYTIQIIDGTGCSSNILEVFVPLQDGPSLRFGFGLISSANNKKTDAEKQDVEGTAFAYPYLQCLIEYPLLGTDLETSISLIQLHNESIIRLSQMIGIYKNQIIGFDYKLQGGISMNAVNVSLASQQWAIHGSISKHVSRLLRAQVSISLTGWDEIDAPNVELGVSIPLLESFHTGKSSVETYKDLNWNK